MQETAATPSERDAGAAEHKPWYRRIPLYVQIVIALVLGVIAGELLPLQWSAWLDVPARMLLQFLGAIAPPLILVAVMRALITANVRGRLAGKMFFLLALNTLVAILIGCWSPTCVQPGAHGAACPPARNTTSAANIVSSCFDNVPPACSRRW
jgi:DAACS family dicarboxylate/amino acid:cation (Na+ or H+) symporter